MHFFDVLMILFSFASRIESMDAVILIFGVVVHALLIVMCVDFFTVVSFRYEVTPCYDAGGLMFRVTNVFRPEIEQ